MLGKVFTELNIEMYGVFPPRCSVPSTTVFIPFSSSSLMHPTTLHPTLPNNDHILFLPAVTAETSASPDDTSTIPLSPIFRTGSDPVLRAKLQTIQPLDCGGNNALRGSDSQLHSKAPPKPIRAPSLLLPDPPDGMDTYWELVPRVPEAPRRLMDTMKVEERWKNRARATETTFGFLDSDKSPDVIQSSKGHFDLDNPRNSKPVYSEVVKTKLVHKEVDKSRTVVSESNKYKQVHSPEERPKTEQSRTEHLSQSHHKPRLSKMDNVILETAEEEDGFIRPQIQTITSYNPKTFTSILLSPENKPLEPNALRKLKEIVSQRDCKESALHILRENCKVSKIYVFCRELSMHHMMVSNS